MKIPEKIKVAGVTYTVVWQDEIADNRDYDGQCHYSKGLIQLANRIKHNDDYADLVFLHELTHAIFENAGLDQDEKAVGLIARGLHSVIVDNPEVFLHD